MRSMFEGMTSGRRGDFAPVVIREGNGTSTLIMRWGLEPLAPGERARTLIRGDDREFPAGNRCLVPATDLPLTDASGRQWRAVLDEREPFFCFAGVWRPATAGWPQAYAVLTVPACPDLTGIKDRHLAFMPRRLWADWLGGAPAAELLKPLPVGSLKVTRVQGRLFGENDSSDVQ